MSSRADLAAICLVDAPMWARRAIRLRAQAAHFADRGLFVLAERQLRLAEMYTQRLVALAEACQAERTGIPPFPVVRELLEAF